MKGSPDFWSAAHFLFASLTVSLTRLTLASMEPSSMSALNMSLTGAASPTTPPYLSPLLLQPGLDGSNCLSVANTGGAPVTIAPCTGDSSQLWSWQGSSVTIYDGAMCLTAANGGSSVEVQDCDGGDDQQFQYTPYGGNAIYWPSNNLCLDLINEQAAVGDQLHLDSCNSSPGQNWNTGYLYNELPDKSEDSQSGTNSCGSTSSQSSLCQTMWMNDADDFCLWAPAQVGTIGQTERDEVAWCTKSGRGTRVIPDGALQGVHFVRTTDYVQVTGVGDLTKINVASGDEGGELDPHGADGNGNPIGGLVFGNTFAPNLQYHEWTSFISDSQFCVRACIGPNAKENCQHIYDEMGCEWNIPANYDAGYFESCEADDDLPMGVYGTSTWYQGQSPTPAAHPAAGSSACTSFPTVTSAPVKRGNIDTRPAATPTHSLSD